MADKNIQLSQRNPAGTAWDNLHPITKAENVQTSGGNNLANDYIRQPGYAGPTGGSATAYTATLDPALPALVAGVGAVFVAHVASGANPSLNIDGKGARPMLKPNGNPAVLVKDVTYSVRYNSIKSAFILLGEGGEYGTAGAAQTLAGYTVGRESGIENGTMVNRSGQLTGSTGVANGGGDIILKVPLGYYDGGATTEIKAWDADFIAANFPADKNMFGLQGTMPNHGAKTYNPSQSAQSLGAGYVTGVTVNPVNFDASKLLNDTAIASKQGTMPNNGVLGTTITTQNGQYNIPYGFTNGGTVTAAIPNLIPSNLRLNVNAGGIIGTLEPKLEANGTGQTSNTGMLTVTGLAGKPTVIMVWLTSFGTGSEMRIRAFYYGNASGDRYYLFESEFTLPITHGSGYINNNSFSLYLKTTFENVSWRVLY